jgi:hypothetical protein
MEDAELKDKLLTCYWRQKSWTSANADLFQGGWKQPVTGITNPERLILPVNEAVTVLTDMETGSLPRRHWQFTRATQGFSKIRITILLRSC